VRILSPLFQANRQASLHIETRLADLGISAAEGQLLAYVEARDAVPVGELVRLLGVPKSTMTSMVHRLARAGLATRRENPDDGRSFMVAVTPAGRDAAREARSRVAAFEAALLARVAPADVEALRRVVNAVTAETRIDLVAEGRRPRTPPPS
jgi:DNA-binding MarR family transcriptional regulator